MFPKISNEKLEVVREAYENGVLNKDIEKTLGVSVESVIRYADRYEWVRPPDYRKGLIKKPRAPSKPKEKRRSCPVVCSRDLKEHFEQTCWRLIWLLEENTNHKS